MWGLLRRARLLVYAGVAALGGAVGGTGRASLWWVLIPLAICMLLMLVGRRETRLSIYIPCLVFLFIGMYLGHARFVSWEGRGGPAGEVLLRGRVEIGSRGEREDAVHLFRVTGVVSGDAAREGDTYLLRSRDSDTPSPRWGDVLDVRGRLFLFERESGGVGGSLVAEQMVLVSRSGNPLLRAAVEYRDGLCGQAESVLNTAEAGLIKGMVLGDYRSLCPLDLKALRLSGLVHLCAASGLHLGILAGLILWLGQRARLSRRAILALQVPALLLFAMAVGLSVPIIRAVVVVLVADIAYFTGRDFDLLPALGAAVLYLVWCNPEAALGVSFQLSLSAALAMAVLYRPLGDIVGAGGSRVRSMLSASLAAQLTVAPVLLYHFGETSLFAALSNLLVLPVVPLVMVLAMLSSLIGAAGLPMAGTFMQLAGLFARWILVVGRMVSGLSWLIVRVYPVPPLLIAAYYAALGGALLAGRRWRKPCLAILAALLALALLVGLPLNASPPGADTGTTITFIDVGQGDAVLLQAASGATVLVDGGMEERVLAAELRSRGVRRIEALVVSHPDSDHIGGLEAALEGCEVVMLLHPATKTDGNAGRLLALAEELGVDVRVMREGDSMRLGDIALFSLGPPREIPDGASTNDYSLVLRVVGPGFSLLLPGDVEEEGEMMLMEDTGELDCDILKVPHHGGFCDTSEEFFSLVDPGIAVISVGENNPFGHPSTATVESLERIGCSVYRTDRRGDIVIRVAEGGYLVECEERGNIEPSFAEEHP